jgi:RimJ/RimL family protein N-acetyltransferase
VTRVPSILTPRIELVSLSEAFLDNLLGGRNFIAEGMGGFPLPSGWPDAEDTKTLKMRFDQIRSDPDSQPWLIRAMVLREGGRVMAGHIGFHGPPTDGSLEMGYTVFPKYRRQGLAMEAAQALMEWAAGQAEIRRFVLSIGPSNEASLAMAEKLGFTQVGEQMDEVDGLEYVFELLTRPG